MIGLAIVLALFGGAGGWIGWRHSTRAIYRRRRLDCDLPPGVTRREYNRNLRRRRRVERVFITILSALMGVVAGVFFLLVIARH